MCTKNQDHIMYGSWDIKSKGRSFLSFWAIICLLTLLTTQNFEKIKKNAWRYYHFPLVYHKWRYVSFLRYRARQTENPGKSNFEKNENNSWRYCHFTHEYHKWSTINEDHIMYDSEILSASGKIFTRFGPFFTHLPSPSSAPLTS